MSLRPFYLILSTTFASFMFALLLAPPLQADEAESSPWQPFVTAIWQASTDEEYHNAQQLFNEISKAGNKLPQKDMKFAWGLNRLTGFLHAQGRHEEEEHYLVRAFRLHEKNLGKKNPLLAEPLKMLAHIWFKRQEYSRAEQALERALKLIVDRYGANHLMTVDILDSLSEIYQAKGDKKKHLEYKRLVTNQLMKTIPSSSPTRAVLQEQEAELLILEGQRKKAAEMQKNALKLYMKTSGPYHLARIKLLRSLANSRQQEGNYSEAIDHLKSALAISENMKGVTSPALSPILIQIAENYQLSGKSVPALPFLKRALELVDAQPNADQTQRASITYTLAEGFRQEGKPEQAIPLYKRTISLLEEQTPHASPLLAETLDALATVLRDKGEYSVAERTNRRALAMWVKESGAGSPQAVRSLNLHRELVANLITMSQPDYSLPKKRRDQVKLIQKRLTNLGVKLGPIDGLVGPKTRTAMAQFNEQLGIIPQPKGKKLPIAKLLDHLPPVMTTQGENQ
ncbi:MAG: tetratricopeptide repeat protein [Magnetococcales bacterium]|nr:tetratricopeptide repeat protein [Magnetococcales bacterium]